MAKKTILAPKTKGKKVPGKLTDYELDYLQYLLEDEYDKGVVVRRAMTHREVADYPHTENGRRAGCLLRHHGRHR
jgi:hypothetical protein